MTGWPSKPAVDNSEEEKAAARVKLIQDWLEAKAFAKASVANEMALRIKVKGDLFPTPKKGTQRFPLANGYGVKLVQSYTYNLGLEIYDKNGEKVTPAVQVESILDEIDKLSAEASRIASKIIKWEPKISYSNYKELDENDPLECEIKTIIDTILIVKESAPSLEFEEPKRK